MNEHINTTDQPENLYESTYALLIRSEEKSRNLLEVAIHPLLMLAPLLAIWQFAQQPVNLRAAGLEKAPRIVLTLGPKTPAATTNLTRCARVDVRTSKDKKNG